MISLKFKNLDQIINLFMKEVTFWKWNENENDDCTKWRLARHFKNDIFKITFGERLFENVILKWRLDSKKGEIVKSGGKK